MGIEEDIEFTVATLLNVRKDNKLRLTRAHQLRDEAHSANEAGRDNYRVEWIRLSVMRIFETLELIAIAFNTEHPEDLCTAKDLGDILMSSLRTLQSI